ncbi:MAG: hypothetical protein H6684_13500 [Deltaproteobacteria bacterium]|nr:hypothetical protein [Deltaproteobacteria bacterium]
MATRESTVKKGYSIKPASDAGRVLAHDKAYIVYGNIIRKPSTPRPIPNVPGQGRRQKSKSLSE